MLVCEAQSISKVASELMLLLVVSFREICTFKMIVSTWHFAFQQNVTYKDFLLALQSKTAPSTSSISKKQALLEHDYNGTCRHYH